jgi:catechol 2,3-dioxygenase-like lactoylglutathione lyase family enzyme
MMKGIRHIALRVRDIERALEFYTRVLKMSVEWRPDVRNVYLTSGSDNLALHEVDSEDVADCRGSLDHLGFLVSHPEEVDEWAQRLQGGGVELVQQPKTHRDGARSIYFRDPDGNLIQLLYHPHIS